FFVIFFFFSSRRRHTRFSRDWSSDVCSSDLATFGDGIKITGLPTIANSETDDAPARETIISAAANNKSIRSIKSYTKTSWLLWRSEERRVGKECRSRWSRAQ